MVGCSNHPGGISVIVDIFDNGLNSLFFKKISACLGSVVVSIQACQACDPGSNPGQGVVDLTPSMSKLLIFVYQNLTDTKVNLWILP